MITSLQPMALWSLEYRITLPIAGSLVVMAPRGMTTRDYDVAMRMLDLIRDQWAEWREESRASEEQSLSGAGVAATG